MYKVYGAFYVSFDIENLSDLEEIGDALLEEISCLSNYPLDCFSVSSVEIGDNILEPKEHYIDDLEGIII